MSPPKLSIGLLGPLEVLDGSVPVELPPSRKARALLAYLVTTGRPHPRSALCDLFWQAGEDPRAGLRWALSKLRSSLHDGSRRAIEATRTQVRFDARAAKVDLDPVEAIAAAGVEAASTEELEAAAQLFRGRFVEGLETPGCHRFEVWCLAGRERLRRLHVAIRTTLVERLRTNPEAAVPHALARLSLAPLDEAGYLQAIEILGAAGRVDQALKLYDGCRETLAAELGVRPSDALEEARRHLIRSRRRTGARVPAIPADSDRAGTGPAPLRAALAGLPFPGHLPEPGPDDAPLVGRQSEIAALEGAFEAVTREACSRALLVSGEAGIGKTRLLREFVRVVRARGGWVLSGPVFETEELRPFGPWIDILRVLNEAVPELPSDPVLDTLLGRPDPTRLAERARLFDAAVEVLAAAAERGGPGVLVVDDVHDLDASSAALLHHAVRTLEEAPILFVLAERDGEMAPASAVARALRSLASASRIQRIPLGRLDPEETDVLVRSLDPTVDADRVVTASEGNPLFAIALAGSLAEGIDPVHGTIADELGARLERLVPEALALLPWGAALGRAFSATDLVALVERPAAEVVEALHGLDRRGVLRVSDEGRYDFSHNLLRRAAYLRYSEPMRREVHRRVAQVLDRVEAGRGRDSGAIAHHAALGGLDNLAAAACAEAAEAFLGVFAFDEARTLVERGLDRLDGLPEEERLPLEMGLLRIYGFQGMQGVRPGDLEARVRTIVGRAGELGLAATVARGHACLMEVQFQRGAYAEAGRSSLRSVEAARGGEIEAAVRALGETAVCLLLLDQAPDDARRLAEEATGLAREHGVEVHVVTLAHAFLQHRDGAFADASRSLRQVIELGRRQGDRWWELTAMVRMTMVELDRGAFRTARSRALETGALADRLDDEVSGALARGLAAVAEARVDRDTSGSLRAVDAALDELRTLDGLAMVARLQLYAGAIELDEGRTEGARERASEALEAARTLNRQGMVRRADEILDNCAALEAAAAP